MMNRRQFLKDLAWKSTAVAIGLAIPGYAFGNSDRKILEGDSDKVLLARMILGEATGCSTTEKLYVGFTPLNRLKHGKPYRNDNTLKKVLLHKNQFSCFNDSTKKTAQNLKRIISPTGKEWYESLTLAEVLLRGEWDTHNFGQTHFYKKDLVEKLEQGKLKINPKKLKPINSENFKHQFYRET